LSFEPPQPEVGQWKPSAAVLRDRPSLKYDEAQKQEKKGRNAINSNKVVWIQLIAGCRTVGYFVT